jgi:ABC-type multidrug transport system fused ATPase/permease subunit
MLKKFFDLLDKKEKFHFKVILFLYSLSFFLEFITLSSLPVFISLIIEPEILFSKIENYIDLNYFRNLEKLQIIQFFGLFVILAFLIKNLFLIILTLFESNFFNSFKKKLSKKIFSFYINAPYEYILKNNPSKISRTVSNEVQAVYGYAQNFLVLYKEVLAIFVIFILIFIVNPLAVVFLFFVFLLISFFYVKKVKPILKKSSVKNQALFASIIKILNETFGSIKDIKIQSKEEKITEKFNEDIKHYEKNLLYFNVIQRLPKIILELASLLLIILLLLFYLSRSSDYSALFPQLALFTVLTVRFIPAFNSILMSLNYIKIFDASINLIKRELNDMENYRSILVGNKNIYNNKIKNSKNNFLSVVDLTYNYPEEKESTLEAINFTIEKGSKVAIVGKTGSGKSTLFNLMLGLLEPKHGNIFFKNKSIYEDLNSWRKQICYTSQNIYLLDSSIKNNITFNLFEEEIDKDKLERAIDLSNLRAKINEMPLGLETTVGHDGIRLSGGERQRIAIARALYRNSNIFFMDEFTSSLDSETENLIVKNLKDNFPDKTMLIISHRKSTIDNCDKILKIDQGKLN